MYSAFSHQARVSIRPGADELPVHDLNLNGHYLGTFTEEYRLYGLGGLNNHSFDLQGIDSDRYVGLNTGAGGEFMAGPVILFSEPKPVITLG